MTAVNDIKILFASLTAAFIPVFAYDLYADNRIDSMLEKVSLTHIESPGFYFFGGIIFFLIGQQFLRK